MSSPSRQMNTRRLPPLPSGGSKSLKHGTPSPLGRKQRPPPLTSQSQMVITGQTMTNGHGSSRTSPRSEDRPRDLNRDDVISFLHDNPDVVEQHVMEQVTVEELELWIKRKNAAKRLSPADTPSVNGDLIPFSEDRSDFKERWSSSSEKRKLLMEFTKDLHQQPSRAALLGELARCMSTAVHADGYNVYLVSETQKNLFFVPMGANSQHLEDGEYNCPIALQTTTSAHAAYTCESVISNDVTQDERFPDGIGSFLQHLNASCVIALPVLIASGDVAGVIELYRAEGKPPLTEEDESLYQNMQKQRKLNDFLLTVTKSIFQNIISMDTVILKIMQFAQELVDADRASLFLVDERTNELYAKVFDILIGDGTANQSVGEISVTRELYARVFDMGQSLEEPHSPSSPKDFAIQKEIRFPIDKGVAGHVASTGQILNIRDAYADDRFNREVDMKTGYKTKSILCMPICIRDNIIGVVQMVNKHQGTFTQSDEEAFSTFAVYCGLALHHAKLYAKIKKSEQKFKVALEVLSYHSKATDDEYERLEKLDQQFVAEAWPQQKDLIIRYDFSPWSLEGNEKPLYVINMFKDLFNMTRFELTHLIKFTLTVRKNYRNVPYHNWAHAFSVAHAMYTIIKTTDHVFTSLERLALYVGAICHDLDHRGKTNSFMVKSSSPLASIYTTSTMEHHHFNQTVAILQCLGLFVACLCHDVDHRGYTNQFMVKSDSPLASIYSTSTMEHHHFNHTITILQHEGHNIFKHLNSDEYKQVLGDIKHCILATDLALFFGYRAKLREMKDKDEFEWGRKDHRRNLMALCMTASDLCSMYKPWELQLKLVQVIMEEFWLQGDEERKAGNTPIPMMDRTKSDQLPNSQGDEERARGRTPDAMMDRTRMRELPKLEVGFLVGICLPCYELLAELLPDTKPMVEGAKANLEKWKELAEKQKQKEELEKRKEQEKQNDT